MKQQEMKPQRVQFLLLFPVVAIFVRVIKNVFAINDVLIIQSDLNQLVDRITGSMDQGSSSKDHASRNNGTLSPLDSPEQSGTTGDSNGDDNNNGVDAVRRADVRWICNRNARGPLSTLVNAPQSGIIANTTNDTNINAEQPNNTIGAVTGNSSIIRVGDPRCTIVVSTDARGDSAARSLVPLLFVKWARL